MCMHFLSVELLTGAFHLLPLFPLRLISEKFRMGKSSIYTFPTTLDIVCKTKVFASDTFKPDTSSAEVPKSNFSPPILLHYIWEHSISFLGLVIVFWPTLLLLDPLKPRHVISSEVSLHEWFSIWGEATSSRPKGTKNVWKRQKREFSDQKICS